MNENQSGLRIFFASLWLHSNVDAKYNELLTMIQRRAELVIDIS